MNADDIRRVDTPHSPNFVAHNRAFEEIVPDELGYQDRLKSLLLPLFVINWKEIPILKWAPKYMKIDFLSDLNAAFLVAVVLVPQAMAYASLAGLDPVYGLYSSTIPLIIYGFFTSSSQVSPGPVAPTAILTEGLIRAATGAQPTSAIFTSAHFTLSALTGIIQLILASLRFGWVADLISWPVMSGFSSGAAFIIITSQLKDALGITTPSEVPWISSFAQRLYRTLENLGSINWATTIISFICFLLFTFWKDIRIFGFKIPPKAPFTLIVLAATILISWSLDFHGNFGVAIIGKVPGALPPISNPFSSGRTTLNLLPGSVMLAVINYVQTISLAVLFGKSMNEKISGSGEMIALGTSSLVGSFFSSHVCTGSFSRSSIQRDSGPRTPAVVIFTGVFMFVFVLTITKPLEFLPLGVLAALVISSARSLIAISDAKRLAKIRPSDLLQLSVTFVCVLVFDIMYGLIAGVLFSLLSLLHRSFRPRFTELGRLRGSDIFSALDRFPEAKRLPGIIVLRFDGELHFGNIREISDYLYSLLSAAVAHAKGEKVTELIPEVSPTLSSPEGLDTAAHYHVSELSSGSVSSRRTRTLYAMVSGKKSRESQNLLRVDNNNGVVVDSHHDETESGDEEIKSPSRVAGVGLSATLDSVIDLTSPPLDSINGIPSNLGATMNSTSSVSASYHSKPREGELDSSRTQDTRFGQTFSLASSSSSLEGGTPAPGNAISEEDRIDISSLRAVIIDGSRIVDIDATACRELQSIMEAYQKALLHPPIQLLFAGLPGPVRDTLDHFGLEKSTNPDNMKFLSVISAVHSIREKERDKDWHEATRNMEVF